MTHKKALSYLKLCWSCVTDGKISFIQMSKMSRISRFGKKKRMFAAFLLAVVIVWHVFGSSIKIFSFYTKVIVEENWTFQTDHLTGFHNKWVGFSDLLGIDCNKAFSHASNNNLFTQKVNRTFTDEYIADSRNCEYFRERFGFCRYPKTSQEEKEFPLAFTILFHKDLDQVLFLLRAIYRPHNVYCLNVDTKSSVEFLEAVRSVARCLPNVFVASKLESIVYAGFSRLMADINCFSDLLKHAVQWKYVINMPGQQFPLRTNSELVKILKSYNGTNDIEGKTKELMDWRVLWIHQYKRINDSDHFEVIQTKVPNIPAPHGLQVVKGGAYGTFSREFLSFVMSSPVALDLLLWSKNIYSPDEYFWSILNYAENISVPGGHKGQPDLRPYMTSYSTWEWTGPCSTAYIRHICIYATEDLHRLINRPEFFLNKFYIDHHPTALHCMDELIYNRTFL